MRTDPLCTSPASTPVRSSWDPVCKASSHSNFLPLQPCSSVTSAFHRTLVSASSAVLWSFPSSEDTVMGIHCLYLYTYRHGDFGTGWLKNSIHPKEWNWPSEGVMANSSLCQGRRQGLNSGPAPRCAWFGEIRIELTSSRKGCTGWVAPLLGASPQCPKGCGVIPSESTYLGCGLDPQSGCVQEASDQCFSHINVALSFSLPLSKNH